MDKTRYIDVDAVKRIMDEKNLTLDMMAKLTGITPRTFRRFLDGASQEHLSATRLKLLLQALDVPSCAILYKN